MNAEAVLFVDNGAGQILKFDVILKQCMGSDKNVYSAAFQIFQNLSTGFAFGSAAEQFRPDADLFAQGLDCFHMLFGQNFGWRHNCRLRAALDRIKHRH